MSFIELPLLVPMNSFASLRQLIPFRIVQAGFSFLPMIVNKNNGTVSLKKRKITFAPTLLRSACMPFVFTGGNTFYLLPGSFCRDSLLICPALL
ncbi:MAG: hypothetical protein V1720_14655 [bacterium]